MAGHPPQYVKEERDAISAAVHDWDGPYSVNVFTPESGFDRKRAFKQSSVDALLDALGGWQASSRTFEEDMELEFRDAARIFVEVYAEKAARAVCRRFLRPHRRPISASVMEDLVHIATTLKADARVDPRIFRLRALRAIPMQQLSARLYSAFKDALRKKADQLPTSREARAEKYSGLMFDVQHAATYAPYCDAFFTDNAMAALMKEKRVAVEKTWGCKVFSSSHQLQFGDWLAGLKTGMTPQHAEDLAWAYPRYRQQVRKPGDDV